jgi:hypothetical protein
MAAIEPGETPSRTLTWKPMAFLNTSFFCLSKGVLSKIEGIMREQDNTDDRSRHQFSWISTCETPFASRSSVSLGVSTLALIGPGQQCACNAFPYDAFGDHLQACQTKSATSQVHDWVVYKMGPLLGSVGHRVKIHKITPATGKELGDIEIEDYVVLQKPQAQGNRLPPPRTLIRSWISR